MVAKLSELGSLSLTSHCTKLLKLISQDEIDYSDVEYPPCHLDHTFHVQPSTRGRGMGRSRSVPRGRRISHSYTPRPPSQPAASYRFQRYPQRKVTFEKKGKNPVDSDGKISRCTWCDSVNHWADKCPDKYPEKGNSKQAYSDGHITLFQGNHIQP